MKLDKRIDKHFKALLISLLFSIISICSISGIIKFGLHSNVSVPEDHIGLLVLEFVLTPAGNISIDSIVHNSTARSSDGDVLTPFSENYWYVDQNNNGLFDGNVVQSDNESVIRSDDAVIDANDFVVSSGTAPIRSFGFSHGVFEQYIDDDHSNSYTYGEAIVRKSLNDSKIRQGDVLLPGRSSMISFSQNIRFIDSLSSGHGSYDDGEAIILDSEPFGTLSDSDFIITPGPARLKLFSGDLVYIDSNRDNRFSDDEAILKDKGIVGKLETDDELIKPGKLSLESFSNELYSDSNGNNRLDSGELIIRNLTGDLIVQPHEVLQPGYANLRDISTERVYFADSNNDGQLNLEELLIRKLNNTATLESTDEILRAGVANLLPLGLNMFIDANNDSSYNDGECILAGTDTSTKIKPKDIETPGKALLNPFSEAYLYTDADGNGSYTGDIDETDGLLGESIFRDENGNRLIDNGELVTSGYANIKPFEVGFKFIDLNGDGLYNYDEAMVTSDLSWLSTNSRIIRSGQAFLKPLDFMKWADANGNSEYEEDEMLANTHDSILEAGEVVKPGLSGLRPFPPEFLRYVYSGDRFSRGSVVLDSDDDILEPDDTVIKPGTISMKQFRETSALYIDRNLNSEFDLSEPIIENRDVQQNIVVLDETDVVKLSGQANILSFPNNIAYIDNDNNGKFHGDSDGDVLWESDGNPDCANDPDILMDGDEVIIKEVQGQDVLSLDPGDVVIRPGLASLRNFTSDHGFSDDGNGLYDNEAIIKNNGMADILEASDQVVLTGPAMIRDFNGQIYIDSNNDSEYSYQEPILMDTGSKKDWLDPEDEIIKPGYARLLPMEQYKFLANGSDSRFTGEQAVLIDKEPTGVLSKNDVQIKPGSADVKNFGPSEKYLDSDGNDVYSDGEPIMRDNTVVKPGLLYHFPAVFRYIDADKSGMYNAYGSPPQRAEKIEVILKDNGDKEINSGPLDGTGPDKVIVSGVANINPIGVFADKIVPPQPGINAYIDRQRDGLLSDFDVLISDNTPTGVLGQEDVVWGKVIYNDGNKFYWSGTQLGQIDGSSLVPPEPSINAYIDSYDLGALSDYEVLITDNPPMGQLGPNDIVWGEIKDKETLLWEANIDEGTPWRMIAIAFKPSEKFLTSYKAPDYNGQAIVNSLDDLWNGSDLIVFEGTFSTGFKNNWGLVSYIDHNHNGLYDYNGGPGECIIDLSLALPGHDVTYPDIIITEGWSAFSDFSVQHKFVDLFPQNNSFDVSEAVVEDQNQNDMVEIGEVVSAGIANLKSLVAPVRYVDSDLNENFSPDEAIIVDGNSDGLLSIGKLDSSGIDRVLSPGRARMTIFSRQEKFVDGNHNGSFDAGEAIIYDWYEPNSFKGEFILAGDHIDKTGSLSVRSRDRDCVLVPSEPNKAGMVRMNQFSSQKFIDTNQSGSYDGFYEPWRGSDYEPIIWTEDETLDQGKLDGSGHDTVLSSGFCLNSWKSGYSWCDDNDDAGYQAGEAIIFDAKKDGVIESLSPSGDRVIVSGRANLKRFNNMKYVDSNNNDTLDLEFELIVEDVNQNDKIENDEVRAPGTIPYFKPFSSDSYRYCDSNRNGMFDLDEAIIYTPENPELLNSSDRVIKSGYPSLTSFNERYGFSDNDLDGIYDTSEAVIFGNGDRIFTGEDVIIVPGIASTFQGSGVKYAVLSPDASYVDGCLIVRDVDNILQGDDVLLIGRVSAKAFDASKYRYSDSNFNNRYDNREAIVLSTDNILGHNELIRAGLACLKPLVNGKYSDSGNRDQRYSYGELLIIDKNSDDMVQPDEILDPGTTDLKLFETNTKYVDHDSDGVYSNTEAIIASEDDSLDSTDVIIVPGTCNQHPFERDIYRFADANGDESYSYGEAIIVEADWGVSDDILEDSDIVLLPGNAGITEFPNNTKFLDDTAYSASYEHGEAIVLDINGDNLLDASDKIVTSGRSALRKFSSTERYIDGGDSDAMLNSVYDPGEAIIRDGNADYKLNYGPLNGAGPDVVISPGKAGLKRFATNVKYVDSNGNNQYDPNEDIYVDNDGNGVVTISDVDRLKYIVVENYGTATVDDIANVKLWADRDNDGKFDPLKDQPEVKVLLADGERRWYEGPASSPLLASTSGSPPIGFPVPSEGIRFFVTVDIVKRPVDGRTIQMGIPANGISTIYGRPEPIGEAVISDSLCTIDFRNPEIPVFTLPPPNQYVYGDVLLSVNVSDTVGISKVEFYDGFPEQNKLPIAVDDNGPPWEVTWDCRNTSFGQHVIYVKAYDKAYFLPSRSRQINHFSVSAGLPLNVALSYSISLSEGWNQISLPLEPFNPDTRSILSSIGENARAIWSYDSVNARWLRYDRDGPEFLNDLFRVESGVGYQIFMSAPGTLEVRGTPPKNSITLVKGWNFIGPCIQKDIGIVDLISRIATYSPSVWIFDRQMNRWLSYEPTEVENDLDMIQPGKAYWISVNNDCVLDFQTR